MLLSNGEQFSPISQTPQLLQLTHCHRLIYGTSREPLPKIRTAGYTGIMSIENFTVNLLVKGSSQSNKRFGFYLKLVTICDNILLRN